MLKASCRLSFLAKRLHDMHPQSRIPSIDILRFAAVLLVLGNHASVLIQYYEYGPWVRMLTQLWKDTGWIGVDLFFVLSGFLVSSLLFRNPERINVRKFLIRRGFKIYPAFYVLIGATFAFDVLSSKPIVASHYYSEIFFVQNYAFQIWPHTWSLAVEEHFYILLPFLLLLLKRCESRLDKPFFMLPAVVAAVCALSLAGRFVGWMYADVENLVVNVHFAATHFRLDALCFGVLLAYYYQFDPDKLRLIRRDPKQAMLAAMVLLAPVILLDVRRSFFVPTFGVSFLYIAFGIILILSLESAWLARLADKPYGRLLTYLGRHSYSIYLWHFPMLHGTRYLFGEVFGIPDPTISETAVYMGASFFVGVIMAKLVEFPALKLRDRLFESHRSKILTEAPA